MKFTKFLKDKVIPICLLIFAIITIEIFLLAYRVDNFIRIYIPVIILGLYIISILIEYYQKNKFYKNTLGTLEKLEEKYLIAELVENSNYSEIQALKEILEICNKSMIENVNKYKYLMQDYKEYIELWIHEVKTPIATSKMIIENNKNDITKSIDEELDKVENYIEQTLYYARGNTVEKDYYIKKSNLKEIVNECIKKNKNELIENKISINTHDLQVIVNTDSKWIVFILNQILQNSIKYKSNQIEMFAKQGKENITLYIKDNGIGIKKGEITRVFEKGFTGTNGRNSNKKSTGIGLYLSKKLCDKLGILIQLNSIENKGTEIKLVFPNSSYINLS